MHEKAKEVIYIFHLMQRSGQKRDLVSFTGILPAYIIVLLVVLYFCAVALLKRIWAKRVTYVTLT